MDIQQNNVAVLHFNLVNQDGSTIFIRKTKLATFNLINPSAVSVPITDIGFDATLNQCWVRVPKASNAATGQYYGVLNIVDDDWGTYTTSKIKIYSVVSDSDADTKSVVFTATCLATQVTNPSGGNSPYYNTTTSTWWQYSDTLKAFEDTGVGNLTQYITKNVQHLKDGTGNGSIVTCLDDEISANNTATGLCSTDLGKNNQNRGESCVALGENNYIAEGVSNATAIAGAKPSAVDVFAVGDKTAGHINVFEINQYGDIYFRPDSSQERIVILQDILDSVIKNVVYDSSNYSLTVTFYSAADNANKIKTYDLSGLKAVLKDDAVKEISVNQETAVMTVTTINGSSQQIQPPTSYINGALALYQKKLTAGTNITITDAGVISAAGGSSSYLFYNGAGKYNQQSGSEVELVGHRTAENGIILGDYNPNASVPPLESVPQLASGENSMAFGYANQATADYAVGIGNANTVSEMYSFGVGYSNTVAALSAYVMGSSNNVGTSASYSIVAGYMNTANNIYSTIFGRDCVSNGNNSTLLGHGLNSNAECQFVIGKYNDNSNEHILEIGFGQSDSQRSNLLYVDYDGDLHCKGDIYYKKSVLTADISSGVLNISSLVKFINISTSNGTITSINNTATGYNAGDEITLYGTFTYNVDGSSINVTDGALKIVYTGTKFVRLY